MHFRRSAQPEDVSSFGPEETLPTNTRGTAATRTQPDPARRGAGDVPLLARRPVVAGVLAARRRRRWSDARTILRIARPAPVPQAALRRRRTHPHRLHRGQPRQLRQQRALPALRATARFTAPTARASRGSPTCRCRRARASSSTTPAVRGGVRAWVWDVAARRDGRPVIVYVAAARTAAARSTSAPSTAAGAGCAAASSTPAAGGSATTRPASRSTTTTPTSSSCRDKVGGRCVVQRWRTTDRGETWTHRTIDAGGARRLPAADRAARPPDRARRRLDAGRLPQLQGLPHGRAAALLAQLCAPQARPRVWIAQRHGRAARERRERAQQLARAGSSERRRS